MQRWKIFASLSLFSSNSIFRKYLRFVLISLGLWFLTKLSKDYNRVEDLTIFITHYPESQFKPNPEGYAIPFSVEAKGFALLKHAIFGSEVAYNFEDIIFINQKPAIEVKKKLGYFIKKASSENFQIKDTPLDIIYLDLKSIGGKNIPVRLETEIKAHHGFGIRDIEISPENLTVSGLLDSIHDITYLQTEKRPAIFIQDEVTEIILAIDTQKLPSSVTISQDKVTIKIFAEEFLEKVVRVPIEFINMPNRKNGAYSFSNDHANITFKFPSSYKKKDLDSDHFKVICDYRNKNDAGVVPLQIVELKPQISKDISLDNYELTIQKK